MKTGVIGLGYVGLPLLVEIAKSGLDSVGIDVDAAKITAINAGNNYIDDVDSGEFALLAREGRITATGDWNIIRELDAISICVPTPLRKTKDPDISFIVNAVEKIAPRIKPGQIIILESTTYPGTTDEILLPEFEKNGLKAGRDFFLAFSPERVDPGNPKFKTRNTPKIIGGITQACTREAAGYYSKIFDTVITVSSCRCAEMVKLLENTFRSVNIGLVNEVAIMCDRLKLNVWEVIDAAATKPFGFMPFYPGPGLGGHC
ncbi:MAG: nucleotide sugar dehydrogenase, partial [Candidatus Sumerlaeota bacterium]|nr:nucleotide sugar dehydrogenase [Candidatus Sumerlaeota bacterium]